MYYRLWMDSRSILPMNQVIVNKKPSDFSFVRFCIILLAMATAFIHFSLAFALFTGSTTPGNPGQKPTTTRSTAQNTPSTQKSPIAGTTPVATGTAVSQGTPGKGGGTPGAGGGGGAPPIGTPGAGGGKPSGTPPAGTPNAN